MLLITDVAHKEVTLCMQSSNAQCYAHYLLCCLQCSWGIQHAVDLHDRARYRYQEERLMGKYGFEWVSGAISCHLLGRASPGRASWPCIPDVRRREWLGSGEEEPSSSYSDPAGLVHMRSLSRVYPERLLNHPVLYTAGHCVPPMYSVAILRLYLVKIFKK